MAEMLRNARRQVEAQVGTAIYAVSEHIFRRCRIVPGNWWRKLGSCRRSRRIFGWRRHLRRRSAGFLSIVARGAPSMQRRDFELAVDVSLSVRDNIGAGPDACRMVPRGQPWCLGTGGFGWLTASSAGFAPNSASGMRSSMICSRGFGGHPTLSRRRRIEPSAPNCGISALRSGWSATSRNPLSFDASTTPRILGRQHQAPATGVAGSKGSPPVFCLLSAEMFLCASKQGALPRLLVEGSLVVGPRECGC